MKHTTLLLALTLCSVAAFSQTDSTKAKPQPIQKQAPAAPRDYVFIFQADVVTKLIQIISSSDEPYATVRKPLLDGILYQANHQPAQDSVKTNNK